MEPALVRAATRLPGAVAQVNTAIATGRMLTHGRYERGTEAPALAPISLVLNVCARYARMSALSPTGVHGEADSLRSAPDLHHHNYTACQACSIC